MKSVIAMLAIIFMVICSCPVNAQETSISEEDRAAFNLLLHQTNERVDSANMASNAENNYCDELMRKYKPNSKKGIFSYDVLDLMSQIERDSLCLLIMNDIKHCLLLDSLSSIFQTFVIEHPGIYSKKHLAQYLKDEAKIKKRHANWLKDGNDLMAEIKLCSPAKSEARITYSELMKNYDKQSARLHKAVSDFNNFGQKTNWGCILTQTMEEGGGSRDLGMRLIESLSLKSLFKGKKKTVTTSTRIHASQSDIIKGQKLCQKIEESLDDLEKVVYEVEIFINTKGSVLWNTKEFAKNKRNIDTNKRQIIAQRKQIDEVKLQLINM